MVFPVKQEAHRSYRSPEKPVQMEDFNITLIWRGENQSSPFL